MIMSAPDKLFPAIIAALWVIWIVYWRASALRTKATERHESVASRASHVIPLIVGAVLIGIPGVPPAWIHQRVLGAPLPLYGIGTILVAVGLAFSIWARLHLGTNWSATVTLKERHELVRSGPYRWVRHPIYTGLLLALLGTALSRNDWCAMLGFALATTALVRKLSIEERWMLSAFKEEYRQYRANVPALIPFLF
jgi:protein-S-isoprenylcysteine O-methyltransferase Ste14